MHEKVERAWQGRRPWVEFYACRSIARFCAEAYTGRCPVPELHMQLAVGYRLLPLIQCIQL